MRWRTIQRAPVGTRCRGASACGCRSTAGVSVVAVSGAPSGVWHELPLAYTPPYLLFPSLCPTLPPPLCWISYGAPDSQPLFPSQSSSGHRRLLGRRAGACCCVCAGPSTRSAAAVPGAAGAVHHFSLHRALDSHPFFVMLTRFASFAGERAPIIGPLGLRLVLRGSFLRK